MNCNPLVQVIEELRQKELITEKGVNMHPVVLLKDAIESLEELESKIWACCEAELLRKQVIDNKKNY